MGGTGYVAELQTDMEQAFRYAREAIGKAVNRQRRNYDARVREIGPELEEGDTVYYYHPIKKKGISPKLQSFWTGPWSVTAVISPVVVEIKSGKKKRVVHVDSIKAAPHPEEHARVCVEIGEDEGTRDPPETRVMGGETPVGAVNTMKGQARAAFAKPRVYPPGGMNHFREALEDSNGYFSPIAMDSESYETDEGREEEEG